MQRKFYSHKSENTNVILTIHFSDISGNKSNV